MATIANEYGVDLEANQNWSRRDMFSLILVSILYLDIAAFVNPVRYLHHLVLAGRNYRRFRYPWW